MKKQLTSIFAVALLVAMSGTDSHGFSGGGGVRPMYSLLSGGGVERGVISSHDKGGNALGGNGAGNGLTGGVEKGFADGGHSGNGLISGFEKGFAQGGSHSTGFASGGFER